MIEIRINDDYAVLEIKEYEFYYGYEHIIDTEWAFYAKNKETGVMTSYTADTLIEYCDSDLKNPVDFLFAGIGLFINNRLIDYENFD